jgi:hypothetical protein
LIKHKATFSGAATVLTARSELDFIAPSFDVKMLKISQLLTAGHAFVGRLCYVFKVVT